MTTVRATETRAKLCKLLDEASESHEPIQITGKRSNAVLISEDDWRSIQETLYLLSIPVMRESIRKGLKTPVKKCNKKPGWLGGPRVPSLARDKDRQGHSDVDPL